MARRLDAEGLIGMRFGAGHGLSMGIRGRIPLLLGVRAMAHQSVPRANLINALTDSHPKRRRGGRDFLVGIS